MYPLVSAPPGSNAEFQTYSQTDVTEPSGTNRFVRKKVGCQGWRKTTEVWDENKQNALYTCMKFSKIGLL